MKDIELTLDEVVSYFQQVYPEQFEITVLRLQNQKLRELLAKEAKDEE